MRRGGGVVSDKGEELFQKRGRSCFRRGGGVVSGEGEGVVQVKGKSCFR